MCNHKQLSWIRVILTLPLVLLVSFTIFSGYAFAQASHDQAMAASGPTSTVSVRVSASTDDAEEVGPGAGYLGGEGNVYVISTDLELVEDIEPTSAGAQTIGIRFAGVTAPKNATITNAYITFLAVPADSPNTNDNTANLTIQGQAADNPSGFVATNNNPSFGISSRPRTTTSVSWTPPAWSSGADYDTPDLSSLVQEIVNRSGWASGNSMVFIITGSGSRSAASYDGDSTNAPQLVIEYALGVSVSPDNATQANAGDTMTYAHTVSLAGGVSEAFALTATSSEGWTTRIYKDVNGNGAKDAEDAQITETSVLTPPATYPILVQVDAPAGTADGTIDTTTATATGQSSGRTASATDTTQVGAPPYTEPVVDGLIDDAYYYNPYSNIQDYCDANGDVLATVMTTYDIDDPSYDNIYIVLEMDRALVDNTYGDGEHPSWASASKSPNLRSFRGSDRAQFDLFDGNGALLYSPLMDYVEDGQSTPSGWGSGGFTDGEGDLDGIDPAYVEGESSLGQDLNTYCTSGIDNCTISGVNLKNDSPPKSRALKLLGRL